MSFKKQFSINNEGEKIYNTKNKDDGENFIIKPSKKPIISKTINAKVHLSIKQTVSFETLLLNIKFLIV